MKLRRRKFLHLAAGAAALPVMSRIAKAQAYPMRDYARQLAWEGLHRQARRNDGGGGWLREIAKDSEIMR
jgi:hypothetical protein